MTRPKIIVGLFAFAGVLFLIAALIPMLRSGPVNAGFVPLGIIFVILAVAVARRNRAPSAPPPSA